jgi:phage terminase large subunit
VNLEGVDEMLKRCQTDPVFHLEEVQGVTSLEDYQRDKILLPILHHERVAIRACHNVGKTWTLAKAVLWIGSTFPGSKIITTAPTFAQVKKLLWSEIRSGHRKSKIPLGGKMLETEWKIDDDWFAVGLSPDDGAESSDGSQGDTSNFQGYHSPTGIVFVVFDEATGVSAKRWIQAEGMMTQSNVKWVAIGNPTSPSSPFAQCFKDPAWFKSHISCFDSPNLKANGFNDINDLRMEVAYLRTLSDAETLRRLNSYKVVNPYLLTAKWVIALALRRGIDSPVFVSKALGDFPDEDDHVMIPMSVVETAQRREYEPTDSDPRFIGIDPARMGTNESVLTRIEGWKTAEKRAVSKRDATEVVGEAVNMILPLPRRRREAIVVDSTGIGGPIADFLRERVRDGTLPSHIQVIDVNFGDEADDDIAHDYASEKPPTKRYANKKAQMFDLLADDMKSRLVILNEAVYQEELPGIRYTFDSKGRYIIESKDKYKKRTGLDSPDSADSLALANFGRHVSYQEGSFTDAVKRASGGGRSPIAPSRGSGDKW